ncbi:acyl-CoA dehydrogenase family protein [Herbidospora mongoliensis]|uniref:acyl-CoA dehydrogenase family protein n=1 Tax=Herbidospora mongoliensis TaxID=688067 RepID=UPI000A01825E|nr:acyl-CoA dehydrogenase [Herbidospora mongoliensis]
MALAEALFGFRYADVHAPWRDLFARFDPAEVADLGYEDRIAATYDRLRVVDRHVHDVEKLVGDPESLAALHEWAAPVDGGLATVAGIHYNLFLGSLLDHGREVGGRRRVGTFLCTEIGHGNNAARMGTTATRDGVGFVLHTPDVAATKFMPNTSAIGGPKTAVVAARLIDGETDQGVFLFVVPLDAPGVRVELLKPKLGPAIDHCLTTFDQVKLGPDALLQGPHGRIGADGVFTSPIGNRRRRMLHSIGRVTAGKLCMSACAVGAVRHALALAVRYAHVRQVAALTGGTDASVPVWAYRSHHAPLLDGLATAYAATLLHRAAVADAGDETRVALTKAWVTWQGRQVIIEARERCGAHGLFDANGIAPIQTAFEGLITAEGDNLAIMVKAAGELLLSGADPGPDPDLLQNLLVLAEGIWRDRARTALRAKGRRGPLDRWNRTSTAALRYAEAMAGRMAAGELLSAARKTDVALLRVLHRLLALRLLAPATGDLLAAGHLTAAQVEAFPTMRDEAYADLAPHALTLVDGFMIHEDVSARHPITAPDAVTHARRTLSLIDVREETA